MAIYIKPAIYIKNVPGHGPNLCMGFFPTGANRMARRIILNHPSISEAGETSPATEALPAKSWVT